MTINPYVSYEMRALYDYEQSKRLPDMTERTALHPYGRPIAPITPGRSWEDCLAAEREG